MLQAVGSMLLSVNTYGRTHAQLDHSVPIRVPCSLPAHMAGLAVTAVAPLKSTSRETHHDPAFTGSVPTLWVLRDRGKHWFFR